jgi:NB-ARC domain
VLLVRGPAGVGKTTTAVQFGYLASNQYPDGKLFGRRDPIDGWDRLLPSFVDALLGPGDVRPTDRAELLRTYRELTRDLRVLVVLDDVDESPQAASLVPDGAGCLAVLTSRLTRVPIDVDLTIDLAPLGHETALELLASIIGKDRVRNSAGAADTIVRASGYYPLAVTLAGTALACRPHWYLELAMDRIRASESGGEVGVLDLTFALLTDEERSALLRLGLLDSPVFAPWMLAALFGDAKKDDAKEDDAWNVADRLVQAGLAERRAFDATGVYSFRLLDQVHEDAKRRASAALPADTIAASRRALHKARQQRNAIDAGEPLMQEIYRLKDGGQFNRIVDVIRDALALAMENRDGPAESLALASLAEINAELSIDTDGAELAEMSEYGGQPRTRLRILRCRAMVMRRHHHIDRAVASLNQALEELEQADLPAPLDTLERIRTLRERAVALAMSSHPRDGFADTDRIEVLLKEDAVPAAQHMASLCWAQGTLLDYTDQHHEAQQVLSNGVTFADAAGQPLWQAWLQHALARLKLEVGEPERCRRYAGAALDLFGAMHHRYGAAHCRVLMIWVPSRPTYRRAWSPGRAPTEASTS